MFQHSTTAAPGFSRRSVLFLGTGLGAGLLFGSLPLAAGAQEAAGGLEEFMRVSARLTGHDDLPPAQGRVAFEALSARFPGFDAGLTQLAGFMDERGTEASGLQTALDEAGAEFAWIPRQIVSAWYLGVVGVIDSPADAEAGLVPPEAVEEGTPAAMHTVAWEQALMFAPLAGTIPIPSYVYRENWAEKPESGG
ncbi:sorbitol dehydrogenase family protein [Paracoccus sp. Z118]|nr:sorbitol dehydrogenase family protein [Paracoccus sp. Z118]MBV0892298.1 sorbitol dehydrogenase family protein [Paracoccus sp. Z118]